MNNKYLECSVAPDYLWMMQLGSLWRDQRCIKTNRLPKKKTFTLLDSSPQFVWRDAEVNGRPIFYDSEVVAEKAVAKYPCYQLLWAEDDCKNRVLLCISSLELVRFFIGMSPALSRHIFGFTNSLENYQLFRTLGGNFLKGVPEGLKILDGNLQALGRKLMVSMLTDPIGKKQILNFVQSCRSAISENRNSDGQSHDVFPVFGLPFKAQCSLSLIGEYRSILIEDKEGFQPVPVFGVTKMVSTNYQPPKSEINIIRMERTGDGATTSIEVDSGKVKTPADIPHDVPAPSNTDTAFLIQMGVDITEAYPGTKNVILKDALVESEGTLDFKPKTDSENQEDITALSTIIGGKERDGSTGIGRGSDDAERPRKEKSLLLLDEDLEDLLKCKPDHILGPEDIVSVNYEAVPSRLQMVAALVLKTDSGLGDDWRKGFWQSGGIEEASLISLSKLPDKTALLENGKPRKAIVAILENADYRIMLADIERRKGEAIAIFSLLMPINQALNWEAISYILEYRLTPAAKSGTWPNAKTHGGGYVAKPQPHQRYFPVEDRYLGGKLFKFVNKVVSQAAYIEHIAG